MEARIRKKKGFTLIELLVVIAIIGILSTLAVVALNNAREKSRDAKRVSDIKQIQNALELYFNDESEYPDAITSGQAIASSNATYMAAVPFNPTPTNDGNGCDGATTAYTYAVQDESNSTYTLSFCLGGVTGDLGAGMHTASPVGVIQ